MVHFVSRFSCLLLFAMIQKMVIHVHSDTIYDWRTNISEGGQDTIYCFNRGHSCKTLVYVLQYLTNYRAAPHHFPSVIINVTNNQTINDTYNVGAPFIGTLHIIGNEGVYINFPYRDSSLQIVHKYTWAWINLRFAWLSSDCENPAVAHFGDTSIQNYVSVLNCTLVTVTWKVVNVTNLVINSTKFSGISCCPTVSVNTQGILKLIMQSQYQIMWFANVKFHGGLKPRH